MKFIALKTEDGKRKGKIAFCCKMLGVSRQGFYRYLVSPSRKNGQEKCEKSRMKQTGANESKVKRQKLHTAAFQNRRAISIQSKSEDELCCRKLQYKQRYRSVPPAWSGSGADEPAHISDS